MGLQELRAVISNVLAEELREDLKFRFPSEDYDRISVPPPSGVFTFRTSGY
jgi:hypothetical protein